MRMCQFTERKRANSPNENASINRTPSAERTDAADDKRLTERVVELVSGVIVEFQDRLGREVIMPDKNEIRAAMKARRKALTPEERKAASEIICAKLAADSDIGLRVDPLDGGSPIAVYLASPQEIDLSPFIRKMLERGVKVVAPRRNGETYELAVLKGLDDAHLRQGPMGILEPVEAEIVSPKEVGVWLVPGLAFTRNGKRLGYGGGWYDRLLAEAPKDAWKIGIAHAFQIVDDLPSESHDILLSKVIVT